MRAKIDPVDRLILRTLSANARIANQDLAAVIGLSPSATLQRMRRLETENVLIGYRADIEEAVLGTWITMWVEVRLTPLGRAGRREFERCIAAEARIVEARRLIGGADYLLKVVCEDISHWSTLALVLDPKAEWMGSFIVHIDHGAAKQSGLLPQLSD